MFSASLSGRVSGIAAALALCLQSAGAAVGDVDVTYAGGAPVFAFPGVSATTKLESQILASGQALIATRCENASAYCLRKISTEGLVDVSYGYAGLLKLGSGAQLARLATGGFWVFGASANQWSVTRLKADATVDTSFGTQGSLNIASPAEDFVLHSLVPQSSDYSLVLGKARPAPGQPAQIFISRLNPQGQWDASFFGAGRVFVPVTIGGSAVAGAAVAAVANSDDRLWVIGQTDAASGHDAVVLTRHFLNGQPDPSFMGNGPWILWADAPTRAVALARDPNGRVFVLAERIQSGEAVLWAFKKGAYSDVSFGTQGRAVLALKRPKGLVAMADGRLLVAGEQGIVRLNANGALDTASAGAAEWKAPATVSAQWQQLQMQRNGRVLLAGGEAAGGVRVVRFLNDDITPAPFAFPAKTGVTAGAVLISDEAAITGIDVAAPVSVTGGAYAIVDAGKCSDSTTTYTTAEGVFTPGAKRICVRVTASSEASATTKATLTVGDVSADFSVTTAAKAEEKKKDKSGSAGLAMLVAGLVMACARRRAGFAGRRAS